MGKAEYVEDRHGIKVSKSHFISKEGARHFDIPTYWVDNGKGGHIGIAKYDGSFYLIQPTVSPHREPIPYSHSGRGC